MALSQAPRLQRPIHCHCSAQHTHDSCTICVQHTLLRQASPCNSRGHAQRGHIGPTLASPTTSSTASRPSKAIAISCISCWHKACWHQASLYTQLARGQARQGCSTCANMYSFSPPGLLMAALAQWQQARKASCSGVLAPHTRCTAQPLYRQHVHKRCRRQPCPSPPMCKLPNSPYHSHQPPRGAVVLPHQSKSTSCTAPFSHLQKRLAPSTWLPGHTPVGRHKRQAAGLLLMHTLGRQSTSSRACRSWRRWTPLPYGTSATKPSAPSCSRDECQAL